MPADVETMAYAMETSADIPWHGLGNPVTPGSTPKEMVVAGEIDWSVSKRPLWAPGGLTSIGPETKYPTFKDYLADPDGFALPISDYFALIRDSDNKVLGPCGKDYVPTQNVQAFEFFDKFTRAGKMQMETAGSLQGGKLVWGLARIVNKSFVLPGDDEVRAYLLLSSPHVWGKSLVLKFTTIKVVCSNTHAMAMTEKARGFRMPHIRPFDAEAASEAEKTLGLALELFENYEASARKLTKVVVDGDVVVRYIADIYQPELVAECLGKSFYRSTELKQAELIMAPDSPKIDPVGLKRVASDVLNSVNRQPGADMESMRGTLWGAFNAVTYHSDHVAGRDRDNAVHSAWFGARAATKTQAMSRALQMATVSGVVA
jgi:phage/plasmid-like protein (TIGR03299 family)